MTVAVAEHETGAEVFARVLAGVDGSTAGREAALQASRLVAPWGALELVTAVYLVEAGLQGWSEERIEATLELEGGPALSKAAALVGPRATLRLLNGPSKAALLEEAARFDATLVALGTHGHSRLSEFVIGGVAGPFLHESPCSVLIARTPAAPTRFPRTIVAGIDGSQDSVTALRAGEHLSRRFDVPLRVILARRGDIDVAAAQRAAPSVELVDGSAVSTLLEASESTDLVVVGSRGLHGLRTLGSVSERVAHKAASSVLVVREGKETPV